MVNNVARVLILDGANICYCARRPRDIKLDPMQTVASCFLGHLGRVLYLFSPASVVVTWDNGLDPRRCALFPDYKANRARARMAEAPEDKDWRAGRKCATKLLQEELLPMLGVDQLIGDGPTEGDDLVAWAVAAYGAYPEWNHITLVSADGDLHQLLTPKDEGSPDRPRVDQIGPASLFKSGTPFCIDGHALKKHTGWYPSDVVLAKAIIGDPADGIPGVHGVGEKSVKEAVEAQGSLVNAIAHLPTTAAKVCRFRNLMSYEAMSLVQRNVKLMTLMLPEMTPRMVPCTCATGNDALVYLTTTVQSRLDSYGVQANQPQYHTEFLFSVADMMTAKAKVLRK
jgi:5'-3' exonuclease